MGIPIHASVLRDALEAILAPSSGSSEDYAIATSIGPGYLARARSGAPTFLIPLAIAPASVGRRGGGFSLSPATRVAFSYAGRRWEESAATLECTEFELLDIFLVLVLDLARKLKSMPVAASWLDILRWVEEWQMLLGRRSCLTLEQQLGLWGELWLIAKATEPDSLVAAWRGPDRDAVDFFFDGIGLEVKVSRRAHVHYVSQRQVELPVGHHSAYLLSIWVGPEPVRGVSLAALVDALLAKVSDPPVLLKKIAELGYSPQDRNHYISPYVVLDSPLWFRATDVPRVRAMDPGISQVRYVVSLDPERCVDEELARGLWKSFCGIEPSFAINVVGLQ